MTKSTAKAPSRKSLQVSPQEWEIAKPAVEAWSRTLKNRGLYLYAHDRPDAAQGVAKTLTATSVTLEELLPWNTRQSGQAELTLTRSPDKDRSIFVSWPGLDAKEHEADGPLGYNLAQLVRGNADLARNFNELAKATPRNKYKMFTLSASELMVHTITEQIMRGETTLPGFTLENRADDKATLRWKASALQLANL